jgi:hypothetical protein
MHAWPLPASRVHFYPYAEHQARGHIPSSPTRSSSTSSPTPSVTRRWPSWNWKAPRLLKNISRQQSFGPDEVVTYLIESKMMQNQAKVPFVSQNWIDLITKNSNFYNEYKNATGKTADRDLPENIREILWDDDSETDLGRGEMFENSLEQL